MFSIIFMAMSDEPKKNLADNSIFLLIGDHLTDGNFQAIRDLTAEYHPADLAFLLNLLEEEDCLKVLQLFEDSKKAEVLPELNESKQQYIAKSMEKNELSQIVGEMDSDDGADIIGLLDKPAQNEVLDIVEGENAEELRELLQHKEDSAGGLMSKEVVSVSSESTVEQAIAEIRKAVEETEQVYNVFVTSTENGELLGILPLGSLVLAKPNTKVGDIMVKAHSVTTQMDQEDVAHLVKKYDLVEVPVVDEDSRLVGRITHDDILDVIEEEAEEDMGRLAGTGSEEVSDHSYFQISRKRLTWLVIGLFGGTISAFIMSRFEIALGEALTLAFFIPVVMSMGGIVGIQSASITVRGLATGEILQGQRQKRLIRELGVTLITGIVCSLLLSGTILLWQHNFRLGFTVGTSMFAVMMVSTLSGTLLPMIFNSFDIDPALATGPFVTTLNDMLGLSIYFGLSLAFLN